MLAADHHGLHYEQDAHCITEQIYYLELCCTTLVQQQTAPSLFVAAVLRVTLLQLSLSEGTTGDTRQYVGGLAQLKLPSSTSTWYFRLACAGHVKNVLSLVSSCGRPSFAV